MNGVNALTGAHFDHWVVDYTSYTPGRPNPALFDTPPPCEGVAPAAAKGRTASQLRLLSLVPAVRYGGDAQVWVHGRQGCRPGAAMGDAGLSAVKPRLPRPLRSAHRPPCLTASAAPLIHPVQYDAFLATHGAARFHASLGEYHARRELLASNQRLIEEHNAGNRSYTLAMNK